MTARLNELRGEAGQKKDDSSGAPSTEVEKSPAEQERRIAERRESFDRRREQAAKDSARRRGKIDLRRALSAKWMRSWGGAAHLHR